MVGSNAGAPRAPKSAGGRDAEFAQLTSFTALVIVVLTILACSSSASTFQHYSGGYDDLGVRDFRVQDKDGRPIQGATLEIIGGEPPPGWRVCRLGGYGPSQTLGSDADGIVRAVAPPGVRFGGNSFRLFLVIRIGTTTAPHCTCIISAEGYRPASIPEERVLDLGRGAKRTSRTAPIKVGNEEMQVPVYEYPVTLRRG